MTARNAAAAAASNENAGPTPTGTGSESSQTRPGTPRSRSKTRPSTSTAPNRPAAPESTSAQTPASQPSKPSTSTFDPSSGTWAAMTPAEEKTYRRLAKRHRLIRIHGAKALEMLAAEENLKVKRSEWVVKHNLSCFKCGTRFADEWIAGGRRANGTLWVACKCIWRKDKGGG